MSKNNSLSMLYVAINWLEGKATYTAIKGNEQVWTKRSTSTADFEFERSPKSDEKTASYFSG